MPCKSDKPKKMRYVIPISEMCVRKGFVAPLTTSKKIVPMCRGIIEAMKKYLKTK